MSAGVSAEKNFFKFAEMHFQQHLSCLALFSFSKCGIHFKKYLKQLIDKVR